MVQSEQHVICMLMDIWAREVQSGRQTTAASVKLIIFNP